MVVYDLSRIGISGESINTDVAMKFSDMTRYLDKATITNTAINKYENNIFTIEGVQYENLGHLASGVYGDVYKVKNLADNKIYALKRQKTIYSTKMADINRIQQFMYNALLEAIVNLILYETPSEVNGNKQIGNVYKFVCDKTNRNEQTHFIRISTIIEFFEGSTLNGYLCERATDRNMYLGISAPIVKKIAESLIPLQNDLKFTHGDFHGGNSMITKDGNIKIIDFGFTRIKNDKLIIESSGYNTSYNAGKDLTILLYSIFGYSHLAKEYDKTGSIYKMYMDIMGHHIFTNRWMTTLHTIVELYEHLDEVDNRKAHPLNLIEKIDELSRPVESTTTEQITTTQTEALRRSARLAGLPPRPPTRRTDKGGYRRKTRKARKLHHGGKTAFEAIRENSENVHATSKKPEHSKRVYESQEPPLSAEYELNKKRDDMSKEAIIAIFEASPVPHIKKYATLIAETYMEEKHKSLQLNLLRTLLYFNSSIQEGAFEFYCESYKNSNKTQRTFMVNTIHFNVIKDCIHL
jgi:hypothetical protein